MARAKQWMARARAARPDLPDDSEKRMIIAACEAFIRDVLKPQFLPEIKPGDWNYVIDIPGAWAAGRYRFMQRRRSGMEHNRGCEFDAPFARIDRMGPDRFDICWMRHTGQWWRVHEAVTLAEVLHILESDQVRIQSDNCVEATRRVLPTQPPSSAFAGQACEAGHIMRCPARV
jgi:hypothetical protein